METTFDKYFHKKGNNQWTLLPNNEVEKDILARRSANDAYLYARNVLQRRWQAAEPFIFNQYNNTFNGIYLYVKDVMKHRYAPVEKMMFDIVKEHSDKYATFASLLDYAQYVIRGRWPEAEPILRTKPNLWGHYIQFLLSKDVFIKDIGANQDTLEQDVNTLLDLI